MDCFGYFLWDDDVTEERTTREGWSYIGADLPDDIGHYRILEEIDGNLYHKNTINPFASFVNWVRGENLMVEKKAYNPEGEHMMQQGIETGAEFGAGIIGGKALGKLWNTKLVTNIRNRFLSKTVETNSEAFIATDNGVVLPKGAKIPNEYVQNPYRSSSYGTLENGKFVEKLRIDAPTLPGKKGPNISH